MLTLLTDASPGVSLGWLNMAFNWVTDGIPMPESASNSDLDSGTSSSELWPIRILGTWNCSFVDETPESTDCLGDKLGRHSVTLCNWSTELSREAT